MTMGQARSLSHLGRRCGGVLAMITALGGCALHPATPLVSHDPDLGDAHYTRDPLPGLVPAAAGETAQTFSMGGAVEAQWWKAFGSSRLDAFEAEALSANADLKAAEAALRLARETFLAQRAAFLPNVQLVGAASRSKNSTTIAPPLSSNAEIYSLDSLGLNVSYLVDVFGVNAKTGEAVAAQLDGQRYLASAVYLTLTANVANAVLQLASLNTQLDDAHRATQANQKALDVILRRRALGEASSNDVALAQSGLAQSEQQEAALQKQIDAARDLLATLLGRTPGRAPDVQFRLADFHLPPSLPVSLPAILVRRRPDVLAAEANVRAAAAWAGVAAAQRYPNVTLTGSLGGASGNLAALLNGSNSLWSFGGAVAQTVFDGGALAHKKKAAEAALEQAKAQHRSAVLGALQSTADVLQAIVDDGAADVHAAEVVEASRRATEIAKNQHDQGQAGVLVLLAAEASQAQAQLALDQARAGRFTDTVALYQALGGDWTVPSQPPSQRVRP